ncbi:sporulation protein [Diplocarpon rosae]|nr:sporulation protein [Diplocarpon rosae]
MDPFEAGKLGVERRMKFPCILIPDCILLANGNSMNNRANIMFFIEHLCDMAARENHFDYIRMMQRDILRIVDAALLLLRRERTMLRRNWTRSRLSSGSRNFELYAEEAAERAKCAVEWKDEFTKKTTGTEGVGPGQTHL